MVEGAGPDRGVERPDGLVQRVGVELERHGQLPDRTGGDWRIERGNESADRLRVDDREGELIRLLRDQPAPDRISLRPEVLAFVVEALRLRVHGDAERDAVDARDDAAVEARRAGIDGDRMALGRIAGGLGAAVHQQAQQPAIVVRRAANQEVVGGVAPDLSQPLEIRLESAGRRDERLRAHLLGAAVPRDEGRGEAPVADVQPGHPGVVFDRDAEALGGAVVRVHQLLAASQEEGVRAREMERAAKRRLKAGAVAAPSSRGRWRSGGSRCAPALRRSGRRSLWRDRPSIPTRGRCRSVHRRAPRACSAGSWCAGCCHPGSPAAPIRAPARARRPSWRQWPRRARRCRRRPPARRRPQSCARSLNTKSYGAPRESTWPIHQVTNPPMHGGP